MIIFVFRYVLDFEIFRRALESLVTVSHCNKIFLNKTVIIPKSKDIFVHRPLNEMEGGEDIGYRWFDPDFLH